MKELETFDVPQTLVAPRRRYASSVWYGMDWFIGDLLMAI